MGIQTQNSILWRSVTVPSDSIYHLLYQQFWRTGRSRQQPKVVIDANPIGFKSFFMGIGPTL